MRRLRALALTLAILTVVVGVAPAVHAAEAAPEDRVLPLEQYTTDKARQLAASHRKALQALNADIYHCLPWLETQRHSIGFFRPKHVSQDDRYLSVRVFIEQDPSPQFANLSFEQQASAMFSRYADTLLRRMAQDGALAADAGLDGYSIVLEWQKQAGVAAGSNPVHETVAIFIPKPAARDYLAGQFAIGQLPDRARTVGWDGETSLGQLRLAGWEDNFVATYKVANYQPPAGVTCR